MRNRVTLDNNRTVPLLELVEAIEKASGIMKNKTHGPEIPGDVIHTWADIVRAEDLLCYLPEISLREGLNKFVNRYK